MIFSFALGFLLGVLLTSSALVPICCIWGHRQHVAGIKRGYAASPAREYELQRERVLALAHQATAEAARD